MYQNNFIKVACITPVLEVGNPKYNASIISNLIKESKASINVFPELCLTGYSCGDLFYQSLLLDDALEGLKTLIDNNNTESINVVGMPLDINGSVFNVAVCFQGKNILGVVPKNILPNSHEFYEKRWFKSGMDSNISTITLLNETVPFGNLIFRNEQAKISFAIELCEDMWSPLAPSNIYATLGCNMTLNLSASNEYLGKSNIRRSCILDNSRRNSGCYIYASSGVNESTSDTVFSGHNIIAVNGLLIKETENFNPNSEIIYADIDISEINFIRRNNTNLHAKYPILMQHQVVEWNLMETKEYKFEKQLDQTPFIPKENPFESFNTISSIQEYALFKRIKHSKASTLVIGVSGGLDSTLALLVAVSAFKKLQYDTKNIIAVTMPGLGTSSRTYSNALTLMEKLGVTVLNISIKDACLEHFKMIGHDENNVDVTYENTQARYRTLILMNLANKHNGIVLGTGDLSELALGWCTYNGDQMSMYGINAGIPKTLVRFMVYKYAQYKYPELEEVLLDIIDTPISPELTNETQKTEDSVGKYEINDFILYRFLHSGDNEKRIIYLLQETFNLSLEDAKNYTKKFFFRFFTQQFKRQALPDGPKVLDISLAPRSDFKMPSDIKRW